MEEKVEERLLYNENRFGIINVKYSQKILVFLIVLEILIGSAFLHIINSNDLQNRVKREYEIKRTGMIKLTKGMYRGNTEFGYFTGEGVFSFNTGTVYSGVWNNNHLAGDGELKIPEEGNYDGNLRNSQKWGRGKFTWNDGTVYDGEWKNDQMDGEGLYLSAEGVQYSGIFKKNEMYSGKCTFINDTGNYSITYEQGNIDTVTIDYTDGSKYSGECDINGLNGKGTLSFVDGDVYQGNFKENLRNGYGIYTWASGDKYDGIWLEDQMTGSGTYTYSDGSYLNGSFENNKLKSGKYHLENSDGTYDFRITDGNIASVEMTLVDGTICSGDINDGSLSGYVRIEYNNGDKYSGKMLNGQRNGQGLYTWSNGASYTGMWSEDKMNGDGIYMYASMEEGSKVVGKFKNGKPDGECQYYKDKKTCYKTDWINGKCVKIYE